MKIFAIGGSMIVCKAEQRDFEEIRALLTLAFGFSSERSTEYATNVGVEAWRVVRGESGKTLLACAALIATGHFFHGRVVKASSIAHVAIAPEARGHGLGEAFIEKLCHEANARGDSMVSLFASTRPVYRKAGFALAGHEVVYEAQTACMPSKLHLNFSRVSLDDRRLAEAYHQKAIAECGHLDRQSTHWRELRRAPIYALACFCIVGDDQEIEAYAIIDTSDTRCLAVRDWYAKTGEFFTALLGFFGQFRSIFPKVRWHGAPIDELVMALPDKGWSIFEQEEWLAKIVNPRQALLQRGYALETTALGLVLDNKDGGPMRLTLNLRDQQADVEEGIAEGIPTVGLSSENFASLFTGFHSASRLARLGEATGSPSSLRLCDQLFAGPRPWVGEHF